MNLWFPDSGCGVQCLPEDAPQVSYLRFVGRLIAAAWVLATFVLLPRNPRRAARALLAALGVRLRVRGELRPGLIVANHISWVDIVTLTALDGAVRLVAKREVAEWPVIGRLAARRRAIFVDRSSPRRLHGTVAETAAALRGGARVAVFPEATTTCGSCTIAMRPAFFQAALDAGVPVTPMTLRFAVAGEQTAAAAFVGDDTLLASVLRMARVRGLELTAAVAPPIFPDAGADRRTVARLAATSLGSPHHKINVPYRTKAASSQQIYSVPQGALS